MPDTTVRVEYIGAVQNFSEVTITGNQQVWRIGSSAFVETGRASKLVASGKFRSLANDPAMLPANQAKVGAIHSSGWINVADGFASIVKTDFVPLILLTLSTSATYAQTETKVTVSATGHNGINRASPTGLRIFWPGSAAIPSGWYDDYTYIDANTFSFTNPVSQTVAAGAAITGTAKNTYIAVCAFQLPAHLASEGAMVTHEVFVSCDTTAATKFVRTRVGGNTGGYFVFSGTGAYFGKRDVTTVWRSGRWYSDGTPSGGVSSAIFDPANSRIELCAFSASDNVCILIDAVKVRYVP